MPLSMGTAGGRHVGRDTARARLTFPPPRLQSASPPRRLSVRYHPLNCSGTPRAVNDVASRAKKLRTCSPAMASYAGARDDDTAWDADGLHAPIQPPVALPGAAHGKSRARPRRPVPGSRVTPHNAASVEAQWCVPCATATPGGKGVDTHVRGRCVARAPRELLSLTVPLSCVHRRGPVTSLKVAWSAALGFTDRALSVVASFDPTGQFFEVRRPNCLPPRCAHKEVYTHAAAQRHAHSAHIRVHTRALEGFAFADSAACAPPAALWWWDLVL